MGKKEKQAFLGILACFLGSQYYIHLYARYNFKIWKKKLFSSRVSFSFFMGLLKTSKLMLMKDAQKHFGSVFRQHAKEIGPAKRKASWELRMFEKANSGLSFLLFFDGPAKNQQAYVSERCPKTLWKCLWAACENLQKNLSNNWLPKKTRKQLSEVS